MPVRLPLNSLFVWVTVLGSALALAGCGSTRPALTSTTTPATASLTRSTASGETSTVSARSLVTRTRLSPRAHKGVITACGDYPEDLQALTGEMKMSNLTFSELKEAARYLQEDLVAFGPALTSEGRSELRGAAAILRRGEATGGGAGVSSPEAGRYLASLSTPTFHRFEAIVTAICTHPPR